MDKATVSGAVDTGSIPVRDTKKAISQEMAFRIHAIVYHIIRGTK